MRTLNLAKQIVGKQEPCPFSSFSLKSQGKPEPEQRINPPIQKETDANWGDFALEENSMFVCFNSISKGVRKQNAQLV